MQACCSHSPCWQRQQLTSATSASAPYATARPSKAPFCHIGLASMSCHLQVQKGRAFREGGHRMPPPSRLALPASGGSAAGGCALWLSCIDWSLTKGQAARRKAREARPAGPLCASSPCSSPLRQVDGQPLSGLCQRSERPHGAPRRRAADTRAPQVPRASRVGPRGLGPLVASQGCLRWRGQGAARAWVQRTNLGACPGDAGLKP